MHEAAQSATPPNTGIFAGIYATIRESLSGAHRDLTQGNLQRTIIILAIPMILEMLMESLFGIVDMFFVARLGVDSLATVALTESCLVLVFGIALGLSMATTAFVAAPHRRKRSGRRGGHGSSPSIALGLMVLSLIVGAAGILYAPDLLRIMGASPSVIGRHRLDLYKDSVGRVGNNFSSVSDQRDLPRRRRSGTGDARALWLANIINIVLDPCLINGWGPFPKRNVMGASIATTTGRGLGVLFQLWMLCGGYSRVRVGARQIRISANVLWRLLRVSFTGILQFLIATASWTVLVIAAFAPASAARL